MKIIPGGRLNAKDIIGRDQEIDRYWRILDRQGLVLSAERRIGKTHILFKMCKECRAGFVPFYQDLESIDSVAGLIRSIHETVGGSMGAIARLKASIAKWSSLLPSEVGGLDLPNVDASWHALLDDVFADLTNSADDKTRILMLWDEFPTMLHNMHRNEGPDVSHPTPELSPRPATCPSRPPAVRVHGFSQPSARTSIAAGSR